ncbi:MAG: DUF2652 domain-containing protein [Candidatus Hermodarchaeota archaeon]
MSINTRNGYLIIGDISGYTSYLAQTELDHAQAVLTELLELIVHRFQPLLKLVKLEGDAVFAYAPATRVPRGESVLEMLEATYGAFRGRVDGIVRHTTCECNACRAIPKLDLKFLAHFGDYMVQQVSGITELVGSDVNLVHRLTKNHVYETHGWRAYALFTQVCLERMGIPPDGMHEQVESYDHLGSVATYCLDLRGRYEELKKVRPVMIRPEEADAIIIHEFAAPPPVVWDWLTDPVKRTQYFAGPQWSAATRPGGRTGVGAKNHCAHGKDAISVETILDWRPFDYYTTEGQAKAGQESRMDTLDTVQLEPLAGGRGTRLHHRLKLKNSNFISRLMLKGFANMMVKKLYNRADQMIQEEMKDLEAAPVSLALVDSGD